MTGITEAMISESAENLRYAKTIKITEKFEGAEHHEITTQKVKPKESGESNVSLLKQLGLLGGVAKEGQTCFSCKNI